MPEQDYYPADEAAPGAAKGEDTAEKEDSQSEEQTALIPKGLLAGKSFKPGEEVVFKIVHEYEDEVEIAYATGEKKKSTMDGADEMIEKMGGHNELEEGEY